MQQAWLLAKGRLRTKPYAAIDKAPWKKKQQQCSPLAEFVYSMRADDTKLDKIPKDAFVVYQGRHGDKSVYRADVILPAAAFSEKEGAYENTEGCTHKHELRCC